MYDYNTSYDTLTTSSTDASGGLLAGVGLGLMLVYLAVVVVMLIACWRLYTKAGKPGWASIVPIYNMVVMLQIVGRPLWWILLWFVPVVNVVIAVIVVNDFAKSFGKDVAWTIGLIFLPFVFYPILAFGSTKYAGPAALAK